MPIHFVTTPIILLLSSSFALAQGPEDEKKIQKQMCQQALESPNFVASEIFRVHIKTKMEEYKRFMMFSRLTLMKMLFTDLKERAKEETPIEDWMKKFNFSNNENSETPPAILDSTLEALKSIQNEEHYKGVNPFERGPIYTRLIKNAKEAVAADPYFTWLKKHAVDNRLRQYEHGSFNLTSNGFEPVYTEKDPIKLLFYPFTISGPGSISWDMSVVRVLRDLDPELTPDQLQMATMILSIYSLEVMMKLDLEEQFEAREHAWGSKEAWNLAPNLTDARKNYRLLLDTALKYSNHMSQSGFELAQKLFVDQGQIMETLRRVLPVNLNGQAANPEDLKQVKELIAKLGLDSSTSPDTVFNLIRATSYGQPSYELFLMRHFGPEQDKILFERTLKGLKLIIELGEVVGDQQSFQSYLVERLKRSPHFHY